MFGFWYFLRGVDVTKKNTDVASKNIDVISKNVDVFDAMSTLLMENQKPKHNLIYKIKIQK